MIVLFLLAGGAISFGFAASSDFSFSDLAKNCGDFAFGKQGKYNFLNPSSAIHKERNLDVIVKH
ncbi:UNVERIFIED_CONTAM: hypothetical protein FKN15_058654 [Acipenser sinensis]